MLAARAALQTSLSDTQQQVQLGREKEQQALQIVADMQTQLRVLTSESQKQSAELASAVEETNASRHDLRVSALAAKTILDQLQMTNESSRDYGSTLLEVSYFHVHPSEHFQSVQHLLIAGAWWHRSRDPIVARPSANH